MKKSFLTGLVIILPLALTIWIIKVILDLLTQPFLGGVQSALKRMHFPARGFLFLSADQLLKLGSQVVILIIIFCVVLLLGMLARWFLVKALFKYGDYLLHRIPLINKLYKTIQEVTKTIFATQGNSFKQVVLVHFPYNEVYALGFISREAPPHCNDPHKFISIFVPTTPNPTSGYLILYPEDEIQLVDMSVEEALKFIISCGVISHKDGEEINL